MRVLVLSLLLLSFSGVADLAQASAKQHHVILCGGPALRKWENLRVKRDQHDRWWANFIRASTLRMVEIRRAYGKDANITWIVYRAGYAKRGQEDAEPYTRWITELAARRKVSLVWVSDGTSAINAINRHPSNSVVNFDFFGHSNKHCFLLDYSADIMGASKAWIHENDLSRIRRGIFARKSQCQSWGCHTGESMSVFWKRATGQTMIGAKGKTNYELVGQGEMPSVSGSWVR